MPQVHTVERPPLFAVRALDEVARIMTSRGEEMTPLQVYMAEQSGLRKIGQYINAGNQQAAVVRQLKLSELIRCSALEMLDVTS